MKIISAQVSVRLGEHEHDMDVASAITKLLETIGFAGPVDITTIPDTDFGGGAGDVIHIDIVPVVDE